jgi:hypothetical protein
MAVYLPVWLASRHPLDKGTTSEPGQEEEWSVEQIHPSLPPAKELLPAQQAASALVYPAMQVESAKRHTRERPLSEAQRR